MATDHSTTGRLAVRNAVWVTIGSYVVQFISFGATLVLVRLLTPDLFGYLSIGIFWSSLLSLSAKFGLNFAAIRQTKLDGHLLGTYYRLEGILAIGSFLLSVVAAIVLPMLGYAPLVSLVIVVMTGTSSIAVLAAPFALAAEKEMQLSRIYILAAVASAIAYSVGIILALAHMGIWSLLSLNIITTLLNMASSYWVCRQRLPDVMRMKWHYDGTLARLLLKQGVPVGLSNVATSTVVNQYDNFLIGTFVSPTTLGYYDRAYRISQWPNNLLTSSLTRVAYITLAKVKDDLPRLTHTVRLALWLLVALGIPFALLIFFGATDIVQVLYGSAWAQSAYFLRFLAIFSLVSPYIALASSLATALGHRRTIVTITGIEALTIVATGTPLTWWLGAPGTILGVGITIAVGFLLSSFYIFRQVSLSPYTTFGPALLATAAASLVTLLVLHMPQWDTWGPLARIAIIAVCGPGLYLVMLFLLRPGEMIERLRYVVQMFRRPGVNSALP